MLGTSYVLTKPIINNRSNLFYIIILIFLLYYIYLFLIFIIFNGSHLLECHRNL